MANISKSGSLSFPEFVLAMHLSRMAANGAALPFSLPENMRLCVMQSIHSLNAALPPVPPVVPSPSQRPWAISPQEKAQSDAVFNQWDPTRSGFVAGFVIVV